MALESYVKFLRATPTAFTNFSKKDPDTLYFVFNEEDNYGQLYLGSRLISGGTITGSTKLSDLEDILIENLVHDSLLVYDEVEEKWVNKPISEVLSIVADVMVGASETADGAAGLVPIPTVADRFKFLRGDGSWATPIAEVPVETQQAIITLQTQIGTLIGEDTNKSVREITAVVLTELLIPENAQESMDTLEEISAWIQEHPEDAAQMNSDISTLKTEVGSLKTSVANLDSRLTLVETSVGTLNSQILALQEADKGFAEDIAALQQAMTWQTLETN